MFKCNFDFEGTFTKRLYGAEQYIKLRNTVRVGLNMHRRGESAPT